MSDGAIPIGKIADLQTTVIVMAQHKHWCASWRYLCLKCALLLAFCSFLFEIVTACYCRQITDTLP